MKIAFMSLFYPVNYLHLLVHGETISFISNFFFTDNYFIFDVRLGRRGAYTVYTEYELVFKLYFNSYNYIAVISCFLTKLPPC